MLIHEKKGKLQSMDIGIRAVEWLELEWYESGKRIMRKQTTSGREVSLKFLAENQGLTQDDVLFENEAFIIAVSILACRCITIEPGNNLQLASACYEIGNKHLPLFYEDGQLLIPFEKPLFQLLVAQGYIVKDETRKLLQPLATTVAGHAHAENETLFSKIMKLTSPA